MTRKFRGRNIFQGDNEFVGDPAFAGGGIRGPIPYRGREWFVDVSEGADTNGGVAWNGAFTTMEECFSHIGSGDRIYVAGKVREQLTTPVGVFDVSIIGAGNRPRHPDAHTGNNGYSASGWVPPATPAAATPLLKVLQQGWSVQNMLLQPPTDAAAVLLYRDGGAGDAERDASHFSLYGCRVDAGQDGVEQSGGCAFVYLQGNLFRGQTGYSLKDTVGAGIGTLLCWNILDNEFMDNASAAKLALSRSNVLGNTFGKFTTDGLNLTGGSGYNVVSNNLMTGTYAVSGGYVSAANDMWLGNQTDDPSEGSETDAAGRTIAVPA